jgi:hypothetical protein
MARPLAIDRPMSILPMDKPLDNPRLAINRLMIESLCGSTSFLDRMPHVYGVRRTPQRRVLDLFLLSDDSVVNIEATDCTLAIRLRHHRRRCWVPYGPFKDEWASNWEDIKAILAPYVTEIREVSWTVLVVHSVHAFFLFLRVEIYDTVQKTIDEIRPPTLVDSDPLDFTL